jgi:alpha-D-ribose 1-methylphosphonate 5-phosphate C-P lyase
MGGRLTIDPTESRRCLVCGSDGSPELPVNCVVDDSEGRPAYVCFDAANCSLNLLEQMEEEGVPCER